MGEIIELFLRLTGGFVLRKLMDEFGMVDDRWHGQEWRWLLVGAIMVIYVPLLVLLLATAANAMIAWLNA